MIRNLDLQRRLYGQSIDTMRRNLVDMGECLNTAAVDLARACTLDRVDLMLARIKGAETTLVHLRRALIAEPCGDV